MTAPSLAAAVAWMRRTEHLYVYAELRRAAFSGVFMAPNAAWQRVDEVRLAVFAGRPHQIDPVARDVIIAAHAAFDRRAEARRVAGECANTNNGANAREHST